MTNLWRTSPAGPFGRTEAAFLSRLVKPLTDGRHRAQAATFASDSDAPVLTHADPAVVPMSGARDVTGRTSQAEQYLTLLVPPEGARRCQRRFTSSQPGQLPRARVNWNGAPTAPRLAQSE